VGARDNRSWFIPGFFMFGRFLAAADCFVLVLLAVVAVGTHSCILLSMRCSGVGCQMLTVNGRVSLSVGVVCFCSTGVACWSVGF
jgi:hypothetical protein